MIIQSIRLTDHQSTEDDLDFDIPDDFDTILSTTVTPNRVRFRVRSTLPTPVVSESEAKRFIDFVLLRG